MTYAAGSRLTASPVEKTIARMPSEAVVRRRARRTTVWSVALVALVALAPRFVEGNGADLPARVVLQGFVKPEDGQLQLLVRIPLALLASFALPKRGPGYLDLPRVEERLPKVTAAVARQIELFEEGTRLAPIESQARVALPSDRSFLSFATARAHFQEGKLPMDTDLYWNQGFVDAALVYPIKSPVADFSVRVKVAPELGERIKLHLEFLSARGPSRAYDLPPSALRVPLEPHWYEAAWAFLEAGTVAPFAVDRLVFLLCLVAPFRGLGRLLAVVVALTGVQAASLIASAEGATPDWRLLAPLFDTSLAVAVVLLAIENVVAPSLRRRWFIASVVGVLSGFGLGHLLVDDWQFAGVHTGIAAMSFTIGVAFGELAVLLLTLAALRTLYTYVTGERLGVVILSLVLAHVAWHWMMDSGHPLEHATSAIVSTGVVAVVTWWIALGVLVGGAAWVLPSGFDARVVDRRSSPADPGRASNC